MKRKKIIIAHSWIEVGINNQTRQLAIALSAQYDVWFLSQSRIGAKQIQVNEHLTVMEWPNKRPTKFKDLWFCWRFFRRVKPNVVMAHFSSIRVSMIGAWLAGVKHRVAWYHTLSVQLKNDIKPFWERMFVLQRVRAAYFFANYVVALNNVGRQDAMQFLHKRESGVFVINNGMLLPLDMEVELWKQGPKRFLFLGRFHQSKGGDFLIECCKILKDKYPGEFKITFVGYGPEEENWKKLVKEAQVEAVVDMPGKTANYKELFQYLGTAYALLVPSRVDNFPTVIIEAFACGVPVIGSAVGGIPEMIDEGKNGFLCGAGDTGQWVNKIEWLMINTPRRNEMALEAKKTYEAKFHIQRHVEKVSALVQGLINKDA